MRFFPYLSSLKPYLVRYRGEILKGYLCVLAQSLVAVVIPILTKRAVDGLTRHAPASYLLTTAGWILAASAVSGIFLYLKRWILIGASRLVEFDLRNDLFRHLQRMPLSFYHRNRTGDLMSRLTNDLNAVRDVLGPALMYGLTTVTTVAAAIFVMVRLDPVLALAALIPFPFMAIIVSKFAFGVHRKSLEVQQQYGVLSNTAQENIAGIRVVQGYVQEEAEKANFAEKNRDYLDRNLALIRVRSLFFGSIALILGLGALALLWIGGIRVVKGVITVGSLVAFFGFFTYLTWPFVAVGWVISLVQRGEASMQRILEIWQEEPDLVGGELALPHPRGDLLFDHVSFRYAQGPEVLHDIRLHVPAGTTLAIVGRTGSGKSSLVNLVPRLHDPTSGRILLDGHDLRDLTLGGLREAIAVVPQDSFLFSDTLEGNIRFGRAGASPEDVGRAAREAQLEPDVASFARGLETRVGERGVTLSGGQRQRTSLARALLKEAAVLILDDALSAVDKSTEELLLHTLRQVTKGRTVLLIAHRVSTVRDADQIVVLDQGRIAERGSYAELMALGGFFADLARRQALAHELEDVDVLA